MRHAEAMPPPAAVSPRIAPCFAAEEAMQVMPMRHFL